MRSIQDKNGHAVVEYLLIVTLVAFAATAGIGSLTKAIEGAFNQISSVVTSFNCNIAHYIPTGICRGFGLANRYYSKNGL